MSYFRSFHDIINWDSRLICIMGQKGVGKSTLMLQHIKKHNDLSETLYVSADNMYFAGHALSQLSIPEKFSKKSPLPEVCRRHTVFLVAATD